MYPAERGPHRTTAKPPELTKNTEPNSNKMEVRPVVVDAKQEVKTMPNYMKYVLGGTAGMMGTMIVQPLDLVKTQMQISQMAAGKSEYSSSIDCIRKWYQKHGILAFYNGLSAALLRQATYTTARMGVYQMEVDAYRLEFGKAPNIFASMGMGIFAGACGAIVGNPAEVSLIRMTADKKLPEAERRNYKNVLDALRRIVTEEGVLVLWRGSVPTVGRAMVVNMVQLAAYSQFKQLFRDTLNMSEGIGLHTVASMCSGFLTTVASMPLDMAKTRIQQQKTLEYTGTIDVLTKVAKAEGVFALWKGFTPYLCRLGPHTVFAFIFLEQLSTAYNKYVLGLKSDSGI